MKDSYDEMAEQFLKDTKTKFSVKWIGYRKHFVDDKQCRHIFLCTFKRNGKQFSVNFGQSIAAGGKTPNAYDVLSCLQKYDVGGLSDFCSDFGYDEDSKKAEKIYNAVCKEFDNVCKIWTDEEIERLQEIY